MKCESMVYLNKVFADLEAPSCPLMGELAAGAEVFDQQLSFYDPTDQDGCGCGCGCGGTLDFDDDLNFVIDSTQVFVNDFALADPASLTEENITVNGITVDQVDAFNERYMVSTNALMARISNCACLEQGASTRAMLFLRDTGPWVAKITVVIRGSVFGCGGCKKFKLMLTTREGVSIDIPGSSTFAVTDICLPCTTGGISPVINISFFAKANLLNPVITTDTGSGSCNIILSGTLVTEPFVSIQVTRQTLFNIQADAVPQECDDLSRCRQQPGLCTCEEDPVPVENPCCQQDNTEPAPTEKPQKPYQICCQFNGCNGCSF